MNLIATLLLIYTHLLTSPTSDNSLRPTSSTSNSQLITHSYYELEYSEEHEQALWVYYTLTPEFINGIAKRKNNFKADTAVTTGSAHPKDYTKSGLDRGHLCPAGAMKINQKAMDETFYMSNISPQYPDFNRKKWKLLEEQVRKWVNIEDTLHVVTGPIFNNNKGEIGSNKVSIPGYFYKVIYDPTHKKKMIGFIFPNSKIENSLSEYVVTIDEIEIKTTLDFFSALPDSIENYLEAGSFNWDYSTFEKNYNTNK